jgi:hypothetical protein
MNSPPASPCSASAVASNCSTSRSAALRREDPDGWVLAVQWHPEFMFDATDALGSRLAGDAPPLLDNRPILDEFLVQARPWTW